MSQQNSQTIATYDKSVDTYVESDMTRSRAGFYNDWVDDVLRDVPKSAQILEIGTAQGRDARYIGSKGYTVQTSDVSDGFLAYLKQHGFAPIKLNIIETVPAGEWDVVYASAVFLHFTNDDFLQALKNIHQALAPGGKLAFTLIQGEGELTKDVKYDLPRYFKYYQIDEAERLLAQVGFKMIDSRSTTFKEKTWLYITVRKAERI
ncbi:MAG: class I SAM-dependent methyltransferase [Candidatus Saccharimonas sp.]